MNSGENERELSDDELNDLEIDAKPMAFPEGHRAGYVAVVGKPNVGKSTLVNALVGHKVAIVSPKPQTTCRRIMGILTREDAQIIFVDTPGIHEPKMALNKFMMREVEGAPAKVTLPPRFTEK